MGTSCMRTLSHHCCNVYLYFKMVLLYGCYLGQVSLVLNLKESSWLSKGQIKNNNKWRHVWIALKKCLHSYGFNIFSGSRPQTAWVILSFGCSSEANSHRFQVTFTLRSSFLTDSLRSSETRIYLDRVGTQMDPLCSGYQEATLRRTFRVVGVCSAFKVKH